MLTSSTSATTEHRTVEAVETTSVMSEAVSNSTLITAGAGTLEKSASKKEVTFAEKHQEFYEPPALPPKTKVRH